VTNAVVRAEEPGRYVFAVLYRDPVAIVVPTRYVLLAVGRDTGTVEALDTSPASPYWIRRPQMSAGNTDSVGEPNRDRGGQNPSTTLVHVVPRTPRDGTPTGSMPQGAASAPRHDDHTPSAWFLLTRPGDRAASAGRVGREIAQSESVVGAAPSAGAHFAPPDSFVSGTPT